MFNVVTEVLAGNEYDSFVGVGSMFTLVSADLRYLKSSQTILAQNVKYALRIGVMFIVVFNESRYLTSLLSHYCTEHAWAVQWYFQLVSRDAAEYYLCQLLWNV